ncbi:MAG: LysR family transcriptional regulator [Hyphomicrobiales bacterium]|nr:MAG: LysR family transcriptional regulator [Hyphomicrobiales bacterium]
MEAIRMLIHDLHHFVALARERNFALAAQACNVTRAAVVTSICDLEKYLEAPLIATQSSPITLTAHGEKALSWARKIIDEYEMMQADLCGARRQ